MKPHPKQPLIVCDPDGCYCLACRGAGELTFAGGSQPCSTCKGTGGHYRQYGPPPWPWRTAAEEKADYDMLLEHRAEMRKQEGRGY